MTRPPLAGSAVLAGLGMLAAGTGLAAAAWALHVTGASPTDAGPPAAPVPHATLQDFPKVPYDGTYTFVRVRFNTGAAGASAAASGAAAAPAGRTTTRTPTTTSSRSSTR